MIETIEINGRAFPVVGAVQIMDGREAVGSIPATDIPMMSDYQWQLSCLNDRLEHPENYENRENLPATIARLRAWLKEHEGDKTTEQNPKCLEISKHYEVAEVKP